MVATDLIVFAGDFPNLVPCHACDVAGSSAELQPASVEN